MLLYSNQASYNSLMRKFSVAMTAVIVLLFFSGMTVQAQNIGDRITTSLILNDVSSRLADEDQDTRFRAPRGQRYRRFNEFTKPVRDRARIAVESYRRTNTLREMEENDTRRRSFSPVREPGVLRSQRESVSLGTEASLISRNQDRRSGRDWGRSLRLLGRSRLTNLGAMRSRN